MALFSRSITVSSKAFILPVNSTQSTPSPMSQAAADAVFSTGLEASLMSSRLSTPGARATGV